MTNHFKYIRGVAIYCGLCAVWFTKTGISAEYEIMTFHAANTPQAQSTADNAFEGLARKFLDQFPKFSPVNATTLGDHRFDDQLDQIDEQTRQRERKFNDELLKSLASLERGRLSRDNQVDFELLKHHLRKRKWELDRLQQWAWDPTVYTGLAGTAVYGLMARDFAPVEHRLQNVAARLEQFPRLYEQIRQTLVPKHVPSVHAETAVKQNRGVVSMLDNMVRPHLSKLPDEQQKRLASAMEAATAAVEEHQNWLEKELLPNAGGDFRLGPRLYDEKLAFTLHTPLTRQQIRDRAQGELQRVRAEMYELAKQVIARHDPSRKPPGSPTREQQQALIAECLDLAAADAPERDGVIAAAKKSLKIATDFVRDRDLVSIPDDPLDIIIMPEFQRGVSVAYCDSPGPLEVGQKTFYAVAPLPDGWNDRQCESFLREYNVRSIHNLTVHEAMPGHFLQLAHSNRNPSKLRAVLYSGVFVEGWACYTEQLLSEEGFLDGDPLMRLVTLKWYLRTISNSLLDQAIHVDGMRRPEAMQLMTGNAFQEEREAAGKWTRAQLTSTQLSTYFVGYQEHRDMRRAAEQAWGKEFSLKRYHDAALSFGSPPTRFVRALLLDEDIAE